MQITACKENTTVVHPMANESLEHGHRVLIEFLRHL